MKDNTLVVLAAGLGSRFGGSKQISQVGPNGQCLMEYSIYDAIEAGFRHVVFVLKEDMVDTVREMLGARVSKRARVDYAVQDFSSLPQWYAVPAERQKPFGTVHAVLCAAPFLNAPFATVNADDYYGKDVYRILHRLLSQATDERDGAMVPYVLGNTMSRNGGVTRGICRVEHGLLRQVTETRNIRYAENGTIVGESGVLSPNALASMNIWGFQEGFLPRMQRYFEDFLKGLPKDELRAECLLPVMVNDLLEQKELQVRAERSNDEWFGLTYREDMTVAAESLAALHAKGAYPKILF